MYRLKNIALLLLILVVFVSCEKVFEFSPYSAYVENDYKNQGVTNLNKIKELDKVFDEDDEFTIAFISDTHIYYDELDKTIVHINRNNKADFIIHGGDMTDGGMIQEFEVFSEIMNKSNIPWITTIGNHDCLANGKQIYETMFGELNFTLDFNNNRFVFFNDIIWELNHAEPDFIWLLNELKVEDSFNHKFVITHIPPWDEQFTYLYSKVYQSICDSTGVDISIHGHHHNGGYGELLKDGQQYMIIGSPQNSGGYHLMTVSEDSYEIEFINI